MSHRLMAALSRGHVEDVEGPTWASDLKAYEKSRRQANPELAQSLLRRADRANLAFQEREFNSISQTYRDADKEEYRQATETKELLDHINRAFDIQMNHERKTYNIVTNEKRCRGPFQKGDQDGALAKAGPSLGDHRESDRLNIISNLPALSPRVVNHPASSSRLGPTPRRPVHEVKDFDIVTNRYWEDHEEKTFRDEVEEHGKAAGKFRQRNAYDPVLQKLSCASPEQRTRAAHCALDNEVFFRTQAVLPLSHRAREAEAADLVTGQVRNQALLSARDNFSEARKARYKTRYHAEAAAREQDFIFQEADLAQRCSQISHERHDEIARRGYDILSNRQFGDGPEHQKKFLPSTVPTLSTWEKALQQPVLGGEVLAPGAEVWALPARTVRPLSTTPRMVESGGKAALLPAAPPVPQIPGTSAGSIYSGKM